MPSLLTKSAFLVGNQCPLRLWFELNEPNPKKEDDPALRNRLRWGQRIGELARQRYPTGQRIRLIGGSAVQITKDLIDSGVGVLFEASFEAERTFAAIDVLLNEADGLRAIEVKMQSGRNPPAEQLLDEVAFEHMVMTDAGFDVNSLEVMRLNPFSVFPNLDDLFVNTDVTADSIARVDSVRATTAQLLPVLDGTRPGTLPGPHCKKPEVCPFFDRCNLPVPPDDIRRLYKFHSRRRDTLWAQGVTSIRNIPTEFPLTPIQARQVEAFRTGARVVSPGLGATLDRIKLPIAFLDFETIGLPIPRFGGMSPFQQVPVQFSCHVLGEDGTIEHHEWLARGDGDPRPEFAVRVLEAIRGAATVVAHHAGFERDCLKETADAVPSLADQLNALAGGLADTEIWLNEHVYDLGFDSSFSLKKVLPALVGKGYDDLEVQEGLTASALLEQLLWEPDWLELPAEQLRIDLLAYCERDTEALVLLWHELKKMSS